MVAHGPTEILFVVEDDAEGGFVATAASASIITQADTLEELRTMVRDAVACHYIGIVEILPVPILVDQSSGVTNGI